MILSEKLLALRTRAGLSQEELAEKLNVSRQSVSKWESGASIPGIDKILEISRIYGISTDYLLKDEMEDLPGEVVADVYHPEDVREISVETATVMSEILTGRAAFYMRLFAVTIMISLPVCVECCISQTFFHRASATQLVLLLCSEGRRLNVCGRDGHYPLFRC